VVNAVAGVSWLVLNDEDTAATIRFNARYHPAKHPKLPVFGEPVYIGTFWLAHGLQFLRRMFKAGFEYSALWSQRRAAFVIICSSKSFRGSTNAAWALRSKQSLCAAYSDDNMTRLELQTVYASLERILRVDWQQAMQVWEGEEMLWPRYLAVLSISRPA